jgi:hypothetical protein
VGDRYRLSSQERSLLYRGVHRAEDDLRRTARRCTLAEAGGGDVWVDTLNVAYTVSAYLVGRPVFLATDGWLRDAGEAHGSDLPVAILSEAIDRICAVLANPSHRVAQVVFVLDDAPDVSDEVERIVGSNLGPLPGGSHIERTGVADELLCAARAIVATSDTRIIERCRGPIIDLPWMVVSGRKKEIVDLRRVL